MEKKKNKTPFGISMVILAVAVAACGWFIYKALKGKETYYSTSKDAVISEYVYCTSNDPVAAFFGADSDANATHAVKIAYTGSKSKKVSYTFAGEYTTAEAAEHDEAVFHAKYNIYMSNNNLAQDSVSNSFMVSDNKLNVTITENDLGDINNTTAPFFFLDLDEIADISEYSMDDFAEMIAKNNFQCEVKK